MHEAYGLTLAAAINWAGMVCLALAMPTHWHQVHPPATQPPRKTLGTLGLAALLASLLVCMVVNHPSMAALTWVMLLSAASLAVALLLAWKPHWLRPLSQWLA